MTRREAILSMTGGLEPLRVQAGSAPFVLIVHPSNRFEQLSRSKVALLFLGKVSRWPWGAEAEPVDLAGNAAARASFLRLVLRMSSEAFAEHWIEQRTGRGISPPTVAATAADAVALVARRPGAVGFVPESEVREGVRILRWES